jgi:hypothetical protein
VVDPYCGIEKWYLARLITIFTALSIIAPRPINVWTFLAG